MHASTTKDPRRARTDQPGQLVADAATVAAVRAFLWRMWLERAQTQLEDPPEDLSGSCAFGSMLAQRAFGGRLAGNHHHQFTLLDDDTVIDLSEDAADVRRLKAEFAGRVARGEPDAVARMGPERLTKRSLNRWIDFRAERGEDPYKLDPVFWGNRDHVDSMRSCIPRVESWWHELSPSIGAVHRKRTGKEWLRVMRGHPTPPAELA